MVRYLAAIRSFLRIAPILAGTVLTRDVGIFNGDDAIHARQKSAIVSTQSYILRNLLDGEYMTDFQKEKVRQVRAGQENLIRLLKKYDIPTGFSTDFIFGAYRAMAQG